MSLPRRASLLLVLGSIGLTLLALEAGLRLTSPHVRLLDTRNFAFEPLSIINLFPMVQYDPTLGYVHKPNYRPVPFPGGRGAFGPLGNRLSQAIDPDAPPPEPPQNAVLAVGDSFTFSSEVEPEQSWPAALERSLGVAVINAGIGGYGADQIVLSAERLLPLTRPRLLIASFIVDTVERTELSVFSGAGKPYFELENGTLQLRNTPVPAYVPSYRQIGWKRRILGYSWLVNWTFDRLGVGTRWRLLPFESRPAHDNGDAVACALMRRLPADTQAAGVKAIIVGQYALPHLHDEPRSARLRAMLACARDVGLPVVDFWEDLQALRRSDPKRLGAFYEPGGHMSAEGNAYAAAAIAGFLRQTEPALFKQTGSR